jgi:signal-transduction protein with cAMP-binding, CBS, and nucleotidyltransferase domain
LDNDIKEQLFIVYSGTVSVNYDGIVLEKLKRGSILDQTHANDLKSAE